MQTRPLTPCRTFTRPPVALRERASAARAPVVGVCQRCAVRDDASLPGATPGAGSADTRLRAWTRRRRCQPGACAVAARAEDGEALAGGNSPMLTRRGPTLRGGVASQLPRHEEALAHGAGHLVGLHHGRAGAHPRVLGEGVDRPLRAGGDAVATARTSLQKQALNRRARRPSFGRQVGHLQPLRHGLGFGRGLAKEAAKKCAAADVGHHILPTRMFMSKCINDKPPMERYIDLMVEGAAHFGVKQEYIDKINSFEKQPRKTPEEMDKFEVSEGLPTWTFDQLAAGTGRFGNPLYFACNGKVIHMTNQREMKKSNPKDTMMAIQKFAGNYAELHFCQHFFDPKGSKRSTNIADFTQLERDYLEDKCFFFTNKNPGNKVVALIEYPEPAAQ